MGYLLTQMWLYILGAFLLGLFAGWLIWGRLKVLIGDLQAQLARVTAERDRLKAELEACGRGRADLERRLREMEAELAALRARPAPAAAPAQFISTPAPKPAPAPAAKPAPAPAAKPAAPAKPDDLRRLIGIGPVNERKLHQAGVTTYAQIAAWSRKDIEEIEKVLEFDGRIDRERWIEQATYLAKGDEKGFLKAFPNADSDNNT